jgi:hypothetical protein
MSDLVRDLRYAARSLRKNTGFALVAVLTLALGIGANAAVFSVVNPVLTPLPYPHPDRLVLLWEARDPARQATNVVNPGNYLDGRDRARSFTDLAAFSWASVILAGDAAELVNPGGLGADLRRVEGAINSNVPVLGAKPGEVLGLVVSQGMPLVGAGLVLGLGGALLATRVLRSLLYGVTPTDPVALVGAGLGLFAVALLAAAIPARRAATVAPIEALRHE